MYYLTKPAPIRSFIINKFKWILKIFNVYIFMSYNTILCKSLYNNYYKIGLSIQFSFILQTNKMNSKK